MALNLSSKMKWLGYGSIMTGYAAAYFDQSALSVALPFIQNEFQATEFQLHWIINIYLLFITLLLLTAGRLADMWGMRRVFLLGVAVFSSASCICALSQSALSLIVFRAIQGVGAALLLPISQSSIYHIFSGHDRGKAIGLFAVSGGAFIAVGPLIGGALTQFSTWRWIFWINPIMGLIAFIGVYNILKELDSHRQKKERFDPLGLILFCLAFTPLIIALMQAQIWGFRSFGTLLLFAISPLFFFIFVWVEKKKRHPLLDLKLFKDRNFTAGILLFLCIQTPIVSTIFFAIFFQRSLGFTPLAAGLALLPRSILVPFIGIPIGHLSNRINLKKLITFGFFALLVAFIWLFFSSYSLQYLWIVFGFFLFSTGAVICVLTTYRLIMDSTPIHQQGSAAGVTMLSRQMGSTLGIALMSSAIDYFFLKRDGSSLILLYRNGFLGALGVVIASILMGLILTRLIRTTKLQNKEFLTDPD